MKKSLSFVVISFTLFLFGLLASILFGGKSFSTVEYKLPSDSLIIDPGRSLYAKDIIRGRFKGLQNNLGMVELHFNKDEQASLLGEDRLVFRIKEIKSKQWYYSNIYGINDFKNNFLLPFGFPIINDSNQKEYLFEVESISGNGKNSVSLVSGSSMLTAYKFSKSEILSSPYSFLNFILIKIITSYSRLNFIYSSLIFYLPLFFYILLVKGYRLYKRRIYLIFLLFAVTDSYVFQLSNSLGIYLGFYGLWLYYVISSKVNYLLSFICFFVLISLCVILISLGFTGVINKLSNYSYFFFVFGIFQMLFEIKQAKSFNSMKYDKKRRLTKGSSNSYFRYGNIFGSATQEFRKDLYSRIGLKTFFADRNILDLGCGYGVESKNFTKFANKVVGYDISVHKSWNKLKNKKLHFLCGNASKLSLQNSEFNAVYAKDLLHHVDNPKKVLREIKRVLTRDAIIVIVEGNRYNPFFYIHATLLNGHNHFTQQEFKYLIRGSFPNAEFKALEAYPPYFLNKSIFKFVIRFEKLIQRVGILSPFFSYNVAIVHRR